MKHFIAVFIFILFCISSAHADVAPSRDVEKVEKYCEDVTLALKDNWDTVRIFALLEEKDNWKEFRKYSAAIEAVKENDEPTTALVGVRNDKAIYAQTKSESHKVKMTDGRSYPTQTLFAEYWFYESGVVAKIHSTWSKVDYLDPAKTVVVIRTKTYNEKGQLALSKTEYYDKSEAFENKPDDALPTFYSHVSALPFYSLLKKLRPEK